MSTADLGIWPVTAKEYHDDKSAVGNSMLKVSSESPQTYHDRFISETLQFEQTPAMRVRTFGHCAILEPARWASEFVAAPKCDRRTNVGKEAFAKFQVANIGKQVVDADEHALACRIRDAVLAHPDARGWIEAEGPVESAIRWQDESTGLLCKALRDKVVGRVILDPKTCSCVPSPLNVAKVVADRQYYRQAAWYLTGSQAIGENCDRFLFVFVRNQEPHEVALYELDPDAIDLGRKENADALSDLARRIENDDWTADWAKEPQKLALPRYLQYRNEYQSNGD